MTPVCKAKFLLTSFVLIFHSVLCQGQDVAQKLADSIRAFKDYLCSVRCLAARKRRFRFKANFEHPDASCLGTLRAIPCGWNSCCRQASLTTLALPALCAPCKVGGCG